MSRQTGTRNSNRSPSGNKNSNTIKIGDNSNTNDDVPPPVRLSQVTAVVPIVYGSIAFFLGKKASEEHTHRWTLYVRGPNDEDLSIAIKKVVFHLHPSFPQPVRELTQPPFEVTEKGWGEFEATIRIVWQDNSQERATVLTHFIKLYPSVQATKENSNVSNGSDNPKSNKPEPVLHEFYDEIVFTNPTESFYEQLQRWPNLSKIISNQKSIMEYLPQYSDEEDFKKLLEAQRFLEEQLINVKDRIQKADAESEKLDEQIVTLSNKARNPTSTIGNTNQRGVAGIGVSNTLARKKISPHLQSAVTMNSALTNKKQPMHSNLMTNNSSKKIQQMMNANNSGVSMPSKKASSSKKQKTSS